MINVAPSPTPWDEFDSEYIGGNKLVQNPKIQGQSQKTICYSFEPYAQDLFNLITGHDVDVIRKDLEVGDIIPIVDINSVGKSHINVELKGGLSVDIDLSREKRFVQLFGYETVGQFMEALSYRTNQLSFLDSGLKAYILEVDPIRISLWEGYLTTIRDEFMREIKEPNKAYVAKIKEANKGGYFVEVQGVEAFMPGSLAAPNKLVDFRSLVGKDVVVMIEDFLPEMNSFIVSHKKYIAHVLPQKIKELDAEKRFTGTITGTSKYGIFVEFDDIFTGLLHVSKMKEFTLKEFKSRRFKAGDMIGFYINEITKDNRIILTEESPTEKREKIELFVKTNKDSVMVGKVAAVMKFGAIINVDDQSGLIATKELRSNGIKLVNGDSIKVKLKEVVDDKLVFKLPD